MRKPKEIEELIKRAIRDEIALHPLKSVAQVRIALFKYGYQALEGPLDWHYVARLMRAIRKENLKTLTNQSRAERIATLKERHRLITQKLADILDGKPISRMHDISYPAHADRVAAANTILKWDMAMFFAEEQSPSVPGVEKTTGEIVQPMILKIESRETNIPSIPQRAFVRL
ncbi:hypothetical protein EBR66_00450 [bacterium]|nr:hypothetical protein [bacterium]